MAKYTTVLDSGVISREDGAQIPIDVRNADYQEYLAWKSEGNEVEVFPNPAPSQEQRDAIAANVAIIRDRLNQAISTNIANAQTIIDIGKKADGYAKNSATNLPTTVLTSAVKDVCSGMVVICQSVLECQKQLVGIEKLLLDETSTTTGT